MTYASKSNIDATLASMSDAEKDAAIADLPSYDKVRTIASYSLSAVSARQMQLWSAFAASLGDDVTIGAGGNIERPSTREEMLQEVGRTTWYKRQTAAEE
jgi:hypothetical protein